METPADDLQQQCEALRNRGFEHLHDEEFEEALEVARQLEELRFSAAFEIAALAHDGLGNLEEAMRVLHRGVEAAPEAWTNWQLLGNFLSDLERFDEAEAAYEQALECEDPWADSIRLNQAVLANRRERFDQALEMLDLVEDPELRFHVAEQRIGILRRQDRQDEAEALAESILAEGRGHQDGGDALARTAAMLGRIHLEQGRDRGEIRQLVFDWIDRDRACVPLMALLRDVDGQCSDQAKSFELTVNVTFPDDHVLRRESAGFYLVCGVVADDADEALEFIRRLEDDNLGETFEIDEQRDSEADPQLLKGVYWRSGRIFYEDED